MLNECNLKNFIECAIQHCDKNTSNKVSSFNELVKCLRNNCRSTIVEYKQKDIKKVMEEAIKKLELEDKDRDRNRKMCYGVYIIYCVCKPEKNDDCKKIIEEGRGEVLYIGKGGTLEWDARYQEQDVIERIGNTRSECKSNNKKYISSNKWFENLSQQYGRICIEIICIDVLDNNNRTPQCKLLTPAFIEKLLLSCYLCERGKLPQCNSEL